MTRTILLADDSVTIQKVIELTFMEEDYDVVSASDGDEALERLEEITPDFVIADVHMPGASGIDVCRRSKELHPGVPVLLLVGTFEPFDEGAAQAAGADAHLKKPFDSQELIQLVGDLMATPEADEPEPAAPETATAGEPEGDDTWGFSAAAADLQAAEEAPAAGGAEPEPLAESGDELPGDFDWAGPLEPLPEEEAPPAAGQAEEPAPTWVLPAEAERPAAAGAEPFHLGPVERAERGDEVFDLRDETAEETAEAPELEAAAGAAGAAAEDRWGTERWGFAVDEPSEEPEAAAAGTADTGWQEVWEPAGSEEARIAVPPPWDDEDDEDDEGQSSAPPPDWDGEAESEVSAPPPDWDGEAESEVSAPPPDWDGEIEAAAEEPGDERAADEAADGGAAVSAVESAAAAGGAAPAAGGDLSEQDVDRIARRVVELLGERVTREVAWEVVPDLAEVVIRERLRELEGQID